MLKKRIIPCLDIKEGRTVKGINFLGLIDAGDPVELAKKHIKEGADELVFLDINATIENRKTLAQLVQKIAQEINISFTVGGGVNSVEDAKILINSGADKISINSSAVKNPILISEIAKELGSQCIVLAVDINYNNKEWMVYIHGGKMPTQIKALDWIQEAEKLGAGEILLTSMNNDGTKNGFALEITNLISETINIPTIASGGAGTKEHFKEVFLQTKVTGALAASIFHFNELNITTLKNYLKTEKIPIR